MNKDLQPLIMGFRRKQLHDGNPLQVFLLGTKFKLISLLIGVGLLRVIRKPLGNQTQEVKQKNVQSLSTWSEIYF